MHLQRICVFTGSNPGVRPEYAQAARELGTALATRKIGLVYGGASVGLMGILADSALAAGGEVIGVIPQGLFRREIAHENLTQLHEVKSMHERKALMADLSDGFIALPGGFGTFDELFEITTWAQIGLHSKPIGLLNVADYFDPLLGLVMHASREGFIPAYNMHLLLRSDNTVHLLELLATYIPPGQPLTWTDAPPER
ncbi:MAG TPA: TIGR00730 family Rossman fold protein [Ktedonobacteraceae bacterium]|nr:TIGR00730 family Rossman fold protein [Ktedonobacteraceae bacterium]